MMRRGEMDSSGDTPRDEAGRVEMSLFISPGKPKTVQKTDTIR